MTLSIITVVVVMPEVRINFGMLTLLPTGPVPYRHTKHQSCKYSLRILTSFTKVIVLSCTYGTNLQQSSPTLNQIYAAESIDRDILMGDHLDCLLRYETSKQSGSIG